MIGNSQEVPHNAAWTSFFEANVRIASLLDGSTHNIEGFFPTHWFESFGVVQEKVLISDRTSEFLFYVEHTLVSSLK